MTERVQTQLRILTQPYNLHGLVPVIDSLSWASPIFEWYATTQTTYIALLSELTGSEKVFLGAIRETTREICRVVTQMWAQGALASFNDILDASQMLGTSRSSAQFIEEWKDDLGQLMAWLDWSVWIKCRPVCGFEVGNFYSC